MVTLSRIKGATYFCAFLNIRAATSLHILSKHFTFKRICKQLTIACKQTLTLFDNLSYLP